MIALTELSFIRLLVLINTIIIATITIIKQFKAVFNEKYFGGSSFSLLDLK